MATPSILPPCPEGRAVEAWGQRQDVRFSFVTPVPGPTAPSPRPGANRAGWLRRAGGSRSAARSSMTCPARRARLDAGAPGRRRRCGRAEDGSRGPRAAEGRGGACGAGRRGGACGAAGRAETAGRGGACGGDSRGERSLRGGAAGRAEPAGRGEEEPAGDKAEPAETGRSLQGVGTAGHGAELCAAWGGISSAGAGRGGVAGSEAWRLGAESARQHAPPPSLPSKRSQLPAFPHGWRWRGLLAKNAGLAGFRLPRF